jgi:hypothetical protein
VGCNAGAAKAISEQTKDVRKLLPPKLELLWEQALDLSRVDRS